MESEEKQSIKIVPSKLHPLGVVCFAFSPDRTSYNFYSFYFSFNEYTRLVIAASIKEENVVNIYKIGDLESPGHWNKIETLSEVILLTFIKPKPYKFHCKQHSQMVSVVDWSIDNLILTGSYDRGLFVWNYRQDTKKWTPNLVNNNKQNRAVIDGAWSPNGKKFAYTTGTYKVFLGNYDEALDWWDSGPLNKQNICTSKGFGSTVLCVSFHPSGNVLAAGSSDYTIRIFTCHLPSADKDNKYKGLFDDIKTRGDELFSVKTGCWVNSINWAPSGQYAIASIHNSSFTVIKYDKGNKTFVDQQDFILWEKLPFRSFLFLNENAIIAGGYDCIPTRFKINRENGYIISQSFKNFFVIVFIDYSQFEKKYEREKKKDVVAKSQVKSQLDMFESSMLKKSVLNAFETERHTNPILQYQNY